MSITLYACQLGGGSLLAALVMMRGSSGGEPAETLVEPHLGDGAAWLEVPLAPSDLW